MATNTYMIATRRPGVQSVAYTETQTNKTYMVAGIGAVTETGSGSSSGTVVQVFVAT